MDIYKKLNILSSLNEDLKEYNEDYKNTKFLITKNINLLLNEEKKIENRSEEVNKKLREEFAEECSSEPEQAKLAFSRWLSDGSLECEFLSPDGETFTKVYGEDDFFSRKSREYKDKIEEQKAIDNIAFQKFGGLMLSIARPQRLANFQALL